MKPARKIYANILCDASGKPFKLIIVEGQRTTEIDVSHASLKLTRKAAVQVYSATDIFISLIQGGH